MSNLDKIRNDILDHALPHVVFDGWSWRTLNTAAKDSGIEEVNLKRAFPKGPRDMAIYFNEMADKRMLEELDRLDIGSFPIRERIATAVKVRLQQNSDHREALRRLLSYLALPGNVMLGPKFTYGTADAIWYAAGDTSTDFNFYSKRGLLMGIYTSTSLYWLADQSEGYSDTWAFLDRRISEVLKIPSLTSALKKRAARVASPLRMMRSGRLCRGVR